MNEISLQTVLEKKDNYNLAIPFTETRQINPYQKISVSLLKVDTSEQAGQIFKVGSKCVRNGRSEQWIDLFSLTKPFLQRLATEAGIQFAPGAGDVIKMDENTWKASAYGALKLPDGTLRTSSNFKVIDLVTEEQKYRIAYEEKAQKGIEEAKAAKAAAEKYEGTWIDTGKLNANGYPIKKYVVSENERAKYVEKSLLDAMAQLRANAPQKAATGAILRVIRDLTGVKGTYTAEELKKPFAVARMAFSPDYNDPMVKQMMLQQCMQSVGSLFGSVPAITQTISMQQSPDPEDEIDIPVVPEYQPEVYEESEPKEPPVNSNTRVMTEEDRINDYCCDKCGTVIEPKVWNYSVDKYGMPLCYKCQKIVRTEQRGVRN